uniref:Uncharacterized protein n=1 Tax=Ditylenchus dipsaci TaxID=166011 RepID=A0A915DWP4_9BILA
MCLMKNQKKESYAGVFSLLKRRWVELEVVPQFKAFHCDIQFRALIRMLLALPLLPKSEAANAWNNAKFEKFPFVWSIAKDVFNSSAELEQPGLLQYEPSLQ